MHAGAWPTRPAQTVPALIMLADPTGLRDSASPRHSTLVRYHADSSSFRCLATDVRSDAAKIDLSEGVETPPNREPPSPVERDVLRMEAASAMARIVFLALVLLGELRFDLGR